MENKLDLSRLTDEEAKHVWEVIQRDFSLRKIEEERLGDLKTKIKKEDTKRELLVSETRLVESHCIRCLQPFKFLVNSKRECLDCKLHVCKACSRYNKKDQGWVCDPCRMTRVLKIGTAGWYHDNVRTRFKRFGSAKVMKSLYKRLNGESSRDDDTQSMPDVRNVYNGHEEDYAEAEAQQYRRMRKNKRLLSVHPMDFELEDYYPNSRRQSVQFIQEDRGGYRNDIPLPQDYQDMYHQRMMLRRKSFDKYMRPDEGQCADSRMVRARSLSKISSSMARQQQYVDTSEEEEYQRYPPPMYQAAQRRRASRASSQENLGLAPPPITDLTKRMTAIESLLNRLEEKMTPADEAESRREEEKLRKKLSRLAGSLSDKGLSSDEEGGKNPIQSNRTTPGKSGRSPAPPQHRPDFSSSSEDEMPTEAQKVYMAAGNSFDLEKKLRNLEQSAKSQFGTNTDSELSELEDVVALAAARVQSTESEVSDLENKIAALTSGTYKSKKKTTGVQQRKRFNQDFPTRPSNGPASYRRKSVNM